MPIDLTSASRVTPFADKSAAFLRRVFRWAGPASYPTGGEVINVGNTFGIGTVAVVLGGVASNGTDLRIARWNPSTNKMQWYDLAGAEIANGTNLSAYSFIGEALGH